MDDEQTDRPPAGHVYPDWPTRHGGAYPPGWLVRYRRRVRRTGPPCAAPVWCENFGTVTGHSLRDEHTSTTWVPVRPQGAAADAPAGLVRATDILDGHPPRSGA